MSEGYKGHRAGSNKGKVHQVFDEKGKEAAIKKAAALDLSESTARTWISSWKSKSSKKTKKDAGKKKASSNARKPVKKTVAKKKAAPKRERIAGATTA